MKRKGKTNLALPCAFGGSHPAISTPTDHILPWSKNQLTGTVITRKVTAEAAMKRKGKTNLALPCALGGSHTAISTPTDHIFPWSKNQLTGTWITRKVTAEAAMKRKGKTNLSLPCAFGGSHPAISTPTDHILPWLKNRQTGTGITRDVTTEAAMKRKGKTNLALPCALGGSHTAISAPTDHILPWSKNQLTGTGITRKVTTEAAMKRKGKTNLVLLCALGGSHTAISMPTDHIFTKGKGSLFKDIISV